MNKDITIGGSWNILGDNYSGDLTFNRSNGVILLHIYFDYGTNIGVWDKPQKIDIIYGNTNQLVKCILTNCNIIKRHAILATRSDVLIRADSIIWGIDEESKVKFNEIHFRLQNVVAWTKLTGFNYEPLSNERFQFDLKFEMPDKISLPIGDDTTIEFVPILEKFDPFILNDHIEFNQYVDINIKKKTLANYEEFFIDFNKVLSLIMIGTSKQIDIAKIKCLDYNKTDVHDRPIEFEMIHKIMRDNRGDKKSTKTDLKKYNFRLTDLIENNLLTNFFETYGKYKSVYDLYLNGIKNDITDEIRFCNLAQALELIHSIKYNDLKKFYKHIDEKFAKDLNILTDIKDNYDQESSSYIILRSRFIDMFINDFSLSSQSNYKTKVIPFVNAICDSRNYYTHYMSSKKNKCIVGENLKRGIFILDYMLTCYILKILGFTTEYINNKTQESVNEIELYKMMDKVIENKR